MSKKTLSGAIVGITVENTIQLDGNRVMPKQVEIKSVFSFNPVGIFRDEDRVHIAQTDLDILKGKTRAIFLTEEEFVEYKAAGKLTEEEQRVVDAFNDPNVVCYKFEVLLAIVNRLTQNEEPKPEPVDFVKWCNEHDHIFTIKELLVTHTPNLAKWVASLTVNGGYVQRGAGITRELAISDLLYTVNVRNRYQNESFPKNLVYNEKKTPK